MKKELLLVLFLTIIFFSIGVHATTTGLISPANPGHNSSQILIPVGVNTYINLQDAIDYGYLLGVNSSRINLTPLPLSTPYELASQILINITSGGKIYTMTLQEAIYHNVFLIGTSTSYTTTLPSGGEYAYNINVNTTSNTKTLQNTINNNLLSSVGSLPLGSSCYPAGVDASCTSAGTIQTGGICGGFSFKRISVACGSDDWHACDGSGHCLGWSGTGCGNCSFGTQSTGSANTGGGSYNAYCYLCNSGTGLPCNAPYIYYNGSSSYNNWAWGNSSFAIYCAYEQGGGCSLGVCTGYSRYDASWKIKP